MTDKEMRRIVDELAEDGGLSPEEYLIGLVKMANDSKMEKFKSYPEDVAKQLTAVEKSKSENRKAKYERAEKDGVTAQITEFVKNFPGVSPEEVPEQVWNEVKNGVSLSHAYALWKLKGVNSTDAVNAEELNAANTSRALPVENDRSEPLAYTMEDVEKMPSSAVKGNYKKILNSMKKWTF
ncbi:MAG: hypothetical protein EOM73_17585 [Bacteroidia bacterium]|nr:hypothetical protein [Bacteroidia bacterium]